MAENTSLKTRVYTEILDGIMSGTFPLDSFLTEGELASRFGVSRAPVREALVQLSSENIVGSIPRAGYQIVRLSPKEIKDAVGLRMILETQALRLAFPRLTADDLSSLHALNNEVYAQAAKEDVTLREWWDGNTKFHLALCSFADNALLVDDLARVLSILRRAIMQFFSGSDRALFQRHEPESHREIENAIRAGNLENATELLARDITSIVTRFIN